MSYTTHLMLKGANITIPLCGNTEIGKVVSHSKLSADCPDCLSALEYLKNVDFFKDAEEFALNYSDKPNLAKHGTLPEAVTGTSVEFWKNIQKFST